MPKLKVDTTPKSLKPYVSQGVEFSSIGESNSMADCVFCGREGKMGVQTETGQFRCVVCGAKGNAISFLQKLHEVFLRQAADEDLADLARQRRMLSGETLREWGVCRSTVPKRHGSWMLPGYSVSGNVDQLYRYARDGASGKMVLYATAELPHGIHGMNLYDPDCSTVYVCEGPWDGMALWEAMRAAKRFGHNGDGRLVPTGNPDASILRGCSVLAVPGVQTWNKNWCSLVAGKRVVLMYDSDHPRTVNGRTFVSGLDGVKRVANLLARAESQPSEVCYLHWGEEGYDPDLPSGYDVRDALTAGSNGGASGAPTAASKGRSLQGVVNPSSDLKSRLEALQGLLDRVRPIPSDWVDGRKASAPAGGVSQDALPCRDWRTLVSAWRKALKWTDGLDRALSTMLASVFSTPTVGEQLWVMVLGAASSAKTTLCEALGLNRGYVVMKDTFTGITSGYQVDRDGAENMSLAPKLHNKTLIINDGDTLLRLPNRDVVLSELRTFYSRNIRVSKKNKMSADFEGINATIILAGTSSLLELDAAELGARFITCDLGVMPEELEDEIALRVAYQAERDCHLISDGKLETRDDPNMVRAKQLTAGYIDYLRGDPSDLLRRVSMEEPALVRCQRLAKFVALLRCRPPKKQEEKVEREMSFRLTKQYVRLAKCLAVVLNRTSVDEEVLSRTQKVAVDTAQGVTMNIVRRLYAEGEDGLTVATLHLATHQTEDKCRRLLAFLRRFNVVESFTPQKSEGQPTLLGKTRWRLTAYMRTLYEDVKLG